MERNARRHETAAEQVLSARLGGRSNEEFLVGDRVMTSDGYPGIVVEHFEGYQGDSYSVVLENGVGGGDYRGNDLQFLGSSGPGSGGEGREVQARRYIEPLSCDRCGKAAVTSNAGGRGGHTALCPDCADRASKTAARPNLPLAPRGEVKTAVDDYPELEDILWTNPDHIASVPVKINNVSLAKQAAAPQKSQFDRVVEDPAQPWWWRKVVGPAFQRVNDSLDPQYQTTDLMRGPSLDWCRFRRDGHCYFPKHFDAAGSAEAGYSVWIPEDRGLCRRFHHEQQKGCSVSEPGPNSGEALWAPDATYSWAQGGQRWDRKYSSLSKDAAWKDVNEKATRIRRDGGVRIISNTGATVTAEVRGDSNIYVTSITRVPGGKGVGVWYCSCDWAKYAWDRSEPWKKYEGRKCAHATALLYEMQANEMFGGEIHEVPEAPTWRHTEPRMERRDGEEAEEYGTQVYDLVTASLSKDEKLLSLGNIEDSILAVIDTAPKEHRALLEDFLSLTTSARLRVSLPRKQAGFTGQVGGRIITDLELTEEGVYANGQIFNPSQVLYPTYDPVAGLAVTGSSSVERAHLLGALSAEETSTCPECGGEGYLYIEGEDLGTTDTCNHCAGRGTVKKTAGPSYIGGYPVTDETLAEIDDTDASPLLIRRSYGDTTEYILQAFVGDRNIASSYYFDTEDEARAAFSRFGSIPDHLKVNHDDAWGSTRYVCREHMGSGRIKFASPEHPCEVCGATSEGASKTASMDEGLPDLLDVIAGGNFTHAGLIIKAASSGRVLLTQRTPFHGDDEETYGKWEFPGGGIDDGEDPLDGAIREFEEETGLTLPESCSIDGHYANENYISIIITVPDEAWTVNADLLDLETMGIGWFDIETIEDVDGFVRPELLRVDYDMVREALVDVPRETSRESVLLDEPEPVMETGVSYGADSDPDESVGYDEENDMTSVAAFVPGDPRLSHLAPGAGDGDGGEDIAKAAAEFLSKSALKTFSPAEQQMLIEEGAHGHVGASNTDRLNIEGTFYESAEADEIGFW
jgi:8-oxo-dGTP pyrophosphatase MutT (NUDIX family)